MFDESWKNWLGGILVALVVIPGIGLIIYAAIQEEKAWQQCKIIYNCRRVDYKRSYSYVEYVDNKGNPHYKYVSSESTYICNGEEIVMRYGE